MPEIDWPGKRLALQTQLAQAQEQVGFWTCRRQQLEGALILLQELAPPESRTESPGDARNGRETMDPPHPESTTFARPEDEKDPP